MTFFKSLIKWSPSRYKFTTFLELLVILVTFYFVLLLCFNSPEKIEPVKIMRPSVDEFQNEDGLIVHQNDNATEFKYEKLVHFDLKGAPPKISYLLNIIPFFKILGATGLLIEYEDMFPYHSELEGIRALNAYTPSDIAAIVETAENNNLTVIPLIPTFGHVEFVLKLQEYIELREVEENPQVLCPSQQKVYRLLENMIEQVLAAHNKSKYLHIGFDEVELTGICPKCQKFMRRKKLRRENLYFNHLRKIAEYIIKTHPGVKPIVWGDKFLKQNEKIIVQHRIPELVDVMLWNYKPHKSTFPRKEDMNSYVKLFKTVWIANAYKGATGSAQMITDIDYHLRNTREWMNFVDEWKPKLKVKGIALTGWQRYNHFMVLCELLPVGLPSLALNLHSLNHKEGSDYDYDKVRRLLNCSDYIPVYLQHMQDSLLLSRLHCDFPGFRIYHKIHSFYITLLNLKFALQKMKKDDVGFYAVVHNASNPAYIQHLNKESYSQYLIEIKKLESQIKIALEEVYDQYTINEWITTYVMPVRLRLEAAANIIHSQSSIRAWPRRPLMDDTLHVTNLFNKICNNNETKGCTFFNIN